MSAAEVPSWKRLAALEFLRTHPNPVVRAAYENATRPPKHLSIADLVAGELPIEMDCVEQLDGCFYSWGPDDVARDQRQREAAIARKGRKRKAA